MYAFDYVRPASIEDALALLRSDVEPRLLAGGQTLLPAMKHRLAAQSTLIDLQDIASLRGLSRDGGAVTVGAMVRHAEVAASPEIRAAIPALAQLAGAIADPMVRNMGTLGGSVANNDPAADYPAAVLALDATIVTDRREIAADDFFTGMFSTSLEADEMIVALRFPSPWRAGYFKLRHPASGYVLAGAFVADFGDRVRLAINGARPCVFRHEQAEQALASRFDPDVAAAVTVDSADFNDDLHADAHYRAAVLPHIIRRAVLAAG